MAAMTGDPSPKTMLRWTTLLVVLANIGFVVDYASLSESPTIAR